MKKSTKRISVIVLSFLCLCFALPFVTGYMSANADDNTDSLFVFAAGKTYSAPVTVENASRVGIALSVNKLTDGEKELSFWFGDYGKDGFENAAVFTLKGETLTYRPAEGDGASWECTVLSKLRDGMHYRFYYDYTLGMFKIVYATSTADSAAETFEAFSEKLDLPSVSYVGMASATELRCYDYSFYGQSVNGAEMRSYAVIEGKTLNPSGSTAIWSKESGVGSLFNVTAIELESDEGVQMSFDIEEVSGTEFSFVLTSSDKSSVRPTANASAKYVTWTAEGWSSNDSSVASEQTTKVGDLFANGKSVRFVYAPLEKKVTVFSAENGGEFALVQTFTSFDLGSSTLYAYLQFGENCRMTVENFAVDTLKSTKISAEQVTDITADGTFAVGNLSTKPNLSYEGNVYTLETRDPSYFYWTDKLDGTASRIEISFDVLSSTVESGQVGFAFAPDLATNYLYNTSGGYYLYYMTSSAGLELSVDNIGVDVTQILAVGSVKLEIDVEGGGYMKVYRKALADTEWTLLQTAGILGIPEDGLYFALQFAQGEFELEISDFRISEVRKVAYTGDDVNGYLEQATVAEKHNIAVRDCEFETYQKSITINGYLCNKESIPLGVGDSAVFEIKNIADVAYPSGYFGFCFGNHGPKRTSMLTAGNYLYNWYPNIKTNVRTVGANGSLTWVNALKFLWAPDLTLSQVVKADTSLRITVCQQVEGIAFVRIEVDEGNGYREIQKLENLDFDASEAFYIGLCSDGVTTLYCDSVEFYTVRAEDSFTVTESPETKEYFEDYNLTLRVNDEAMGSVGFASSATVAGDRVTATVTVNDGYVFTGWVDKDGTVLSRKLDYEFVMPYHDYALTATMEKGYKVRVLTKNGETENVYLFGAGYDVLVNDMSVYLDLKLTGWKVDGVEAEIGEDLSVSFVMPEAEVTLTAIYAADNKDYSTDTDRIVPGSKELSAVIAISIGGLVVIAGCIVLYYYLKKRRNG